MEIGGQLKALEIFLSWNQLWYQIAYEILKSAWHSTEGVGGISRNLWAVIRLYSFLIQGKLYASEKLQVQQFQGQGQVKETKPL